MKHTILPNGDLEFSLEADDDAEEIREWSDDWNRVLEACGLLGNGWTEVAPEWIAALTSAPIVSDDFDLDDEGTYTIRGRVWWFPNYAVEDPVETLASAGRVVFTLAP